MKGDPQRTEDEVLSLQFMYACGVIREIGTWLLRHAMHGHPAAQWDFFDLAQGITSSFIAAAKKKLPGIVARAKGSSEIPGFISRDEDVQKEMASLCREIEQGAAFPVPQEPPGRKGAKRKAKLSKPEHDLVDRLFGYIESYRLKREVNPLMRPDEIKWQREMGYFVSPLVEEMVNLPPLNPATWKEWQAMGREIINERTGGDLLSHPAFKPDGVYATLGHRDANKEEFANYRKGIERAWKLRAKRTAALPDNSPNRKDFTRLHPNA